MFGRKVKRKNPLLVTVFDGIMRGEGTDYRGIPTCVCPCGCDTFIACVKFDDDRELAWYLLDGVCALCGSLVTLPTPIDGDDDDVE
jgi:hypothetical protein